MVKEVEVDRDPESDPERREGEFIGETSSGGTLSCETPAPAQPVRPGAIAVPGNRPSSHWDMLGEDDDDEDDTRGPDNDELPVAAAISAEDEDAAFFRRLGQMFGEAIPVAGTVVDPASPRRRKHLPFLIAAALLILAGVAAAVVGVVVSGNGKGEKEDANETDAVAQDSSNTTDAPTSSPTADADRLSEDVVASIELEFGQGTAADLQVFRSPQQRAALWISQEDEFFTFPLDRNTSTREHFRQRFALATLYFATGGDTTSSLWTKNYDFTTPNLHECNWNNRTDASNNTFYGVSCDGTSVVNISIIDNGLVGSIPSEVGALSNLESLVLTEGALTGSLPSEFSALTNLKFLILAGQQLSGSFPSVVFNLTSLETLSLSRSNFAGSIPSSLKSLSSLRFLFLHDNDFTGNLPDELPDVEDLSLGNNAFSGFIPAGWSTLSNLRVLDIGGNNLGGSIPSFVSTMTDLSYIVLNDNQVTGPIPSELSVMTQLEAINLSGNRLGGTLPKLQRSYSVLRYLLLNDNSLSGTIPLVYGRMPKLVELSVAKNLLTGECPVFFTHQPSLEFLDVSINLLTGSLNETCAAPLFGNVDSNSTVVLADCTEEVSCRCCTDCYDKMGRSERTYCEQAYEAVLSRELCRHVNSIRILQETADGLEEIASNI